jgi:hypothetical protein
MICIMYMAGGNGVRTTLIIEDNLIEEAARLTGTREKTALVKMGLEALIARESARRLAKLGGTEKELDLIPRRRETVKRESATGRQVFNRERKLTSPSVNEKSGQYAARNEPGEKR